jgi:dCTP deaminase
MLKNDRWIKAQAAEGMLEPFQPQLVRHLDPDQGTSPVLSFGCSSYGYDLRLSAKEFLIFRHVPGTVMNPKRFNPANLEPAPLHGDDDGSYFILPAHSYGLGVALERMRVPANITVICLGKSTYARLGIIVNTTPAEASWEGHLTLEFSNSSGADCRIYANEGICQLLFLRAIPVKPPIRIARVNIKIKRNGSLWPGSDDCPRLPNCHGGAFSERLKCVGRLEKLKFAPDQPMSLMGWSGSDSSAIEG